MVSASSSPSMFVAEKIYGASLFPFSEGGMPSFEDTMCQCEKDMENLSCMILSVLGDR